MSLKQGMLRGLLLAGVLSSLACFGGSDSKSKKSQKSNLPTVNCDDLSFKYWDGKWMAYKSVTNKEYMKRELGAPDDTTESGAVWVYREKCLDADTGKTRDLYMRFSLGGSGFVEHMEWH